MAETFFDAPPALAGSADAKLQQLYNHLGIMSNKLNEALMTISIEQLPEEVQRTVRAGSETEQAEAQDIVRLKSLIIKNAEIVRTEMDEIRTTLESTMRPSASSSARTRRTWRRGSRPTPTASRRTMR